MWYRLIPNIVTFFAQFIKISILHILHANINKYNNNIIVNKFVDFLKIKLVMLACVKHHKQLVGCYGTAREVWMVAKVLLGDC